VRDKIVIQTKCPYYTPETKDNTYMDRLKIALKKVRSDYIDVLLAHAVSQDKWKELGQAFMNFATSAKRQGLIRHIGFSSHDDPKFVMQLIESGDFDVMLVPYNMIETKYKHCLARAHQLGLGTSVMNPVGGGRLAEPTEQLLSMIDKPVPSTVDLALRFVFANDNIDTALSGMTHCEWVRQNAALVEVDHYLTAEDEQRIQQVSAEKEKLAKLYCTGCRYCMPCPHGVDIPYNFLLMNMHRQYGLTQWAKKSYAAMRAKGQEPANFMRASACTQCGECEPKCPNNIPIIEQLQEVDKALGEGLD